MKSVVVIGAGLGGLSAAALLAKAGLKTIIFEKTAYIGGRCRSIWYGNSEFGKYPFDVGPIFSGSKIINLIKERLKEKPAFQDSPVKIHIFSKGRYLTDMFSGRQMVKNFKRMGLSSLETISLIYRLWRQRYLDAYSYMDSHHDIACFLTKNQQMRNIFNMRAGLFHGCLPDDMPGYTFSKPYKEYGTPFYPTGGMQKIPDTFVNIIKKYGGRIYTSTPVSEVLIEEGRAVGVVAQGEYIKSDFVISGVSIVQTILKLCKGAKFSFTFLDKIKSYKQGLEASMTFMIVNKDKVSVENGNVLYVSLPSSDLNEVMHQFFNGIYPDDPPFGLFLTEGQMRFRPATLLFYTPRGEINRERIIQEGRRLLERINLLIPGFTKNIVWKRTVTSIDYPDEIGFRSCVLPVAESKTYRKVSFRLPIKNLFNVGSSVLPAGGGTVQAVKSGLKCAEFIIKNI